MRTSIRSIITVVATVLSAQACDSGHGDGLGQVVAPVKTVCGSGSPTLFGIDVSKWQGTIDWSRVKAAGVKYAFIRVSDGISTLDERFVANWNGAGAQGIPRGVYQFFRAHRDPVAQADIVIDHLLQHGVGELPPVIDVEATNGQSAATVAANVGIWIERVEAALGVTPIIYTGSYFWDNNVGSSAYAAHPLWTAHYTSAACPLIPNAWSRWTFWQYSDSGRVDGISGDVDMNRFDGTEAELLALAGDPICKADPGYRACVGDGVRVCSASLRLTTIPCAADEVCDDGACVREVGPTEPNPEVVEPVEVEVEPGPEAVEVEVEPVEPGPEAVEGAEVVEEPGAYALGAGRSVSGRALTSGGCGAGHGAWWSLFGLVLVRSRRRR